MLVSDLLHSCAHEEVAEAAVASIGGPFASHLQADAEERGVSVGFLTAGIVRSFARHASERDWRDLVESVRGQDFPVLHGLQVVLTKTGCGRRPTAFEDTRPSFIQAPSSTAHQLTMEG